MSFHFLNHLQCNYPLEGRVSIIREATNQPLNNQKNWLKKTPKKTDESKTETTQKCIWLTYICHLPQAPLSSILLSVQIVSATPIMQHTHTHTHMLIKILMFQVAVGANWVETSSKHTASSASYVPVRSETNDSSLEFLIREQNISISIYKTNIVRD